MSRFRRALGRRHLPLTLGLVVIGFTVTPSAAGAATLGKTTIGAVNGGGLIANVKRVNAYQLNLPALVSKLDIYLSPSAVVGSQVMEGVIYADKSGSPGALVAQSQQISFSNSSHAGWYDLPMASTVTLNPGKYWLGIYTGGTSAVASYWYDTGPSRARLANNQTYAKGGASNPFGAVGWSDTYLMSLYATYTVPNGRFLGVSCTSSTACSAVGYGSSGVLAERWNDSRWSIQTTPNATGFLSDVSCTSSTTCMAVGGGQAERWNGTSWSILTTPSPDLSGISCTSSTACTAVGSSNNAVTLAERWNGTSWSIQTTSDPGVSSSFAGVSCTLSTACTAVGTYEYGSAALAERWNGTSWSIQTAPPSSLSGVSCTSSTLCTAVGSSGDWGYVVAERWNGTSWSIQIAPTPGISSGLTGISCTSSTACTAVGWYENSSGTSFTLAERWNGTSWSIQTTPNPTGTTSSGLSGVSCTSSTACSAVGYGEYSSSSGTNTTSADVTLAERWNGTSWSIQTTPSR